MTDQQQPEYILLKAWAERKFDPVPSVHTLRALARTDRIEPPPQLVGRDYYVEPDAKLKEPGSTLVRKLKDRRH